MGGGRIEFILGPFGLIIAGVLLFIAIMRMARGRAVRSSNSDPMGLETDGEEQSDSPSSGKSILPSFKAFLNAVARPRRLAHPDWERLDGAVGVPGRPIAWFERDGTLYGVSGETRMDALAALDEWMLAHPDEDPLMTLPGRKGVGRLGARPETGWTDQKALRIETG